jgi:hypothetical protein
MKRTAIIAVIVLTSACAKHRPAVAPNLLTFTEVAGAPDEFHEEEEELNPDIPAFDPLRGAGIADQIAAPFRGTDRKDPKTSIAPGSVTTFTDVAGLAITLPPDTAMRSHTPPITKQTMTRMAEEQKNVRVPAWIYAIKYEADQDWHVIIGTSPTGATRTFFNAEVSGLPPTSASAFPTLKTARQSLADLLNNNVPATNTYRVYDHPVPVMVQGSLFFDVDHEAGVVGPTGMRPMTAWEIHPVTKLTAQ